MAVRAIEVHEYAAQPMEQARASTSTSVTDEHSLLAAAIANALSACGCHAQVTESLGASTDELVLTTALCDGDGAGDGADIHWRAMLQAQAFRAAGGKSLILLQDTGGQFHGGPSQGWHGGMAALARTASLEWPDMSVRCIDIAIDPDDLASTAQRLLVALKSTFPVLGVDLAGRVHCLQAGELLSQPKIHDVEYSATRASDVWLVSGGARGVTAACIEALAQQSSGSFALLGRSIPAEWPSDVALTDDVKVLRRLLAANALAAGDKPVPKDIEQQARQLLAGQEIRDTLHRLNTAGVSAQYYPCDIADQQQVRETVALVQRAHGRITALVHGAGVLADSLLIDKTQGQLDRVFNTKVGGLKNLLHALPDTSLTHVALFSSAAAFYGNTGQADYAMANEVLNRVARTLKLRSPNAIIKSFNWGPWDSGMVDQTLARYFEERGIGLIPVQEGANLFAEEMLAGDHRIVELLVGDPWAG